MAERSVKIESRTARLMQDAEKISEEIKNGEKAKKIITEELLEICQEKDLDKITLDDGERQLLATIKVVKDSKAWDDERIKKVIPPKLRSKVIKKVVVETETIDYDAITDLFENGEIEPEDYLSMFANKRSEYVQVRRVAR